MIENQKIKDVKSSYLNLLKGQGILLIFFFLATIVELIIIIVEEEYYQLLRYSLLVIFAGCLICFVGLVVYAQPLLLIFKKTNLDEKREELFDYTLTRKKLYNILFYVLGVSLGIGGIIYEIVTFFIFTTTSG